MTAFDEYDEALDDLPRYFAVVGQHTRGWLPGDGHAPLMETCVSVTDVREMLRRVTARSSGPTDTLARASKKAPACVNTRGGGTKEMRSSVQDERNKPGGGTAPTSDQEPVR